MTYLLIKWVHILSSTILFGTGIGTAFFLLVTTLSRDVAALANVTRQVVRADWLFTSTTAVIQPATGLWLLHLAGIPLSTSWVAWSLAFYVAAIVCWLPVLWLQMRMRDLAAHAHRTGTAPGREYWLCFRYWVMLGVGAFIAFLMIFYLMVFRPA